MDLFIRLGVEIHFFSRSSFINWLLQKKFRTLLQATGAVYSAFYNTLYFFTLYLPRFGSFCVTDETVAILFNCFVEPSLEIEPITPNDCFWRTHSRVRFEGRKSRVRLIAGMFSVFLIGNKRNMLYV